MGNKKHAAQRHKIKTNNVMNKSQKHRKKY